MTTAPSMQAERALIVGRRRVTCLSPTLVRLEFAPDGVFEPRRSLLAYAPQQPLAWQSRSEDGDWLVLDTGCMEVRLRRPDRAFTRQNLEIRWSDGRLLQFWRPGDRDYQNLGGTLRSLDRYGGEACALGGVHPATMESPDVSGTHWPTWMFCEVDPLYEPLHPHPPEGYNRGHWLAEAQRAMNDGRYLERTFNWYRDARKFCPGVLSASGYCLLNDSAGAVLDADDFPVERDRPGYQDWYFFAYGRDYKQALQDFRLLADPAPIPPHQSLGIIFSRWPAFTRGEIEAMVRDFRAHGYPLSTLVMDMEWHKEGWGHWEFNPELIPDPAEFFAYCRRQGVEVTFNDHPLDVREDDRHFADYVREAGPNVVIQEREYQGKRLRMARVDICDKQQNRAFRDVCHREIMDLGLDYWWNDGSRGQMDATCGQLVCNKTFFEESERGERRGMLLARYGGLGSHRYGAFFTGDANSDFHVLRLQCEFNIRAGGVGISQVSHDIGGFALPSSEVSANPDGVPIIDPERYLRWLQFGVFGPLLRFHAAPGCGSRKPYDYDDLLDGACRHWLRVRHSLLPYLYTAAHLHHNTGIPLIRGMYLEAPDDLAAYRFDQYYFGPDMVVAPVLSAERERTLYLPAGQWWDFATAEPVDGGREFTRSVALDEVPVYVRAGSIIPRRDPDGDLHTAHISPLVLDIYPGADGEAVLYEDDGTSPRYKAGEYCLTSFTLAQEEGAIVVTGAVSEGAPLGETREILLDIILEQAPTSVVLNDAIALSWQALDTARRYRITVPNVPAAQPFRVAIKRV